MSYFMERLDDRAVELRTIMEFYVKNITKNNWPVKECLIRLDNEVARQTSHSEFLVQFCRDPEDYSTLILQTRYWAENMGRIRVALVLRLLGFKKIQYWSYFPALN